MKGQSYMNKWSFTADFDEWNTVSEHVFDSLLSMDISRSDLRQIMMSLEELISNIIKHGQSSKQINIQLELFSDSTPDIVIILEDDSEKFNPIEYSVKNVISSTEDDAGGWGIDMAKQLTDKMEYSYLNGKNRLYIVKKRGGK